jgi:hypothetical protein
MHGVPACPKQANPAITIPVEENATQHIDVSAARHLCECIAAYNLAPVADAATLKHRRCSSNDTRQIYQHAATALDPGQYLNQQVSLPAAYVNDRLRPAKFECIDDGREPTLRSDRVPIIPVGFALTIACDDLKERCAVDLFEGRLAAV